MNVLQVEGDRILVACAFCKGTGTDPFGIMSYRSSCYACLGRKASWVAKPVRMCPHCVGTGVSPTGGRNYCMVCHGRGVVTAEDKHRECRACNGSGTDETGLYCISCRGTGVSFMSVSGAPGGSLRERRGRIKCS